MTVLERHRNGKLLERRETTQGGLCFRCEHRAAFLEEGLRPRHECGEVGKAVNTCYCFTPCRPLVLRRAESEKDLGINRPVLAPSALAARSTYVRFADARVRIGWLDNEEYVFVYELLEKGKGNEERDDS
jgi:hypothetical protein